MQRKADFFLVSCGITKQALAGVISVCPDNGPVTYDMELFFSQRKGNREKSENRQYCRSFKQAQHSHQRDSLGKHALMWQIRYSHKCPVVRKVWNSYGLPPNLKVYQDAGNMRRTAIMDALFLILHRGSRNLGPLSKCYTSGR